MESSNPLESGVSTSGLLQGISIPDLIWAFCRDRLTGTLHVQQHEVRKSVYIEDGRIVFSASNCVDERLGEILLREGLITLDQVSDAVDRIDTGGKRLGTLLVEAGHLEADDLVRGVLSQVQAIVLSLFTWTEGSYRFDEGPLPTDEVIKLDMNTPELLLQGIRRIRSFARIRKSVGPPQTYYRPAENLVQRLEGLSLTEGEDLLAQRMVAGGGDSVESLCGEVFLSNFEIYQTLWAFKVLGLIVEAERPVVARRSAALEGLIDEHGLTPVLVRLARAGETGVLHVTRGAQERTVHFREGRCIFATSNDFEDGLLAHLLRRGVISIQDRNETAKRLLSNKRVGTILREIGAIDEQDLEVMVREQLSELIFDTLAWTRGDYAFVSGELPTIEEITLDASVEQLITRGLKRISSWSRIERGCGGVDMPQMLSPRYLEILDRMDIGADEWTVVSALTEPRTVTDLARNTGLPGWRVGQIAWVLRSLGALIPVEEAQPVAAPVADTEPEAPSPVEPPEEIPLRAAEVDDEAFEVTDVHATLGTADVSEASIEPSDWSEPEDADRLDAERLAPEVDPERAIEVSAEAETETETETETAETPFEHDEVPPIDSPLDATQYIEPEAVAAAIREDYEAAPEFQVAEPDQAEDAEHFDAAAVERTEPEPEPEPWDPPEDLEALIERLNQRQRVVYRTIRAEIGAGAANFIRSCAGQLSGGAHELFSEAELFADGTWDRTALADAVRAKRVDDPWIEYERLIETEIDQLRALIGEARADALYEQVAGSDGPTDGPSA